MAADAKAPRPGRKWMIFTIVVLCAISLAGYLHLRVDTTLEPLLPEDSQARDTVIFLRDSSFASKGVLWFRLSGEGDLADLMAASDAVEKQLDPKLIKRVLRPPSEADALDEMLALLDHAGSMLNEQDLAELDPATRPEALKQRMRDIYIQLTKPQGAFMQRIIERDPLGVNARVLARLYELSSGLGYRMEVKNGHFVHPDGKQLLLIFETGASVTSLDGSKALVKHLDEIVASAPANVSITPICPQIHTKQNDELMHADMERAGTIDLIAFLALFLIVCRDWRVAAVFFLPVATTAITVGLCGLAYPTLSVMVIGLSATMAGSAVDYGIFVYTAIKAGHDWHDDVRRIRRHLLLSLLTTLGVFVAFLFSDIPAYRQLGYLTSVSLILAMLGAVFVLPMLIKPGGKILAMGSGMPLRRWGKYTTPIAIIAVLALAGGAFAVRHMRFDPDVARLDGASAQVKQNEADFQKTWARSDDELAILVVTGKSLDEAERKNDEITRLLKSKFKDRPFISLSSFWPSSETRRANLQRWNAYWTDERIAELRKNLASAGEPYGFTDDAFAPFFDNLGAAPTTAPSRQILSSIEEQFIARANGSTQILSYFEDTDQNVTAARELVRDHPGVQVISRRALGQAFAESASSENKLLVAISLAFIATSLLTLTRSPLKSVLIMLPAAAGIVAMLVTLKVLSLPLSVVSVIAGILVIGLSSDYGIFSVFAWDEDETLFGHGMTSMHLSSMTTLIGTTSLLFAQHPVLFLVGVSLTSGLLTGYLTALFVVPALLTMLRGSPNLPHAVDASAPTHNS